MWVIPFNCRLRSQTLDFRYKADHIGTALYRGNELLVRHCVLLTLE